MFDGFVGKDAWEAVFQAAPSIIAWRGMVPPLNQDWRHGRISIENTIQGDKIAIDKTVWCWYEIASAYPSVWILAAIGPDNAWGFCATGSEDTLSSIAVIKNHERIKSIGDRFRSSRAMIVPEVGPPGLLFRSVMGQELELLKI